MSDHRVAITGLGVVSPIGHGKDVFWQSLLDGANAIGEITRFNASNYPSRIAAEIRDFDPSQYMEKRRLQWTDYFSQLAVVCAMQACEDANFRPQGRSDVGVYAGSALGGIAFAEQQMNAFQRGGLSVVQPLLTLSVFGGAAASNIAIQLGINGPTIANSNSCAAGAIAIGEAFHAIRRGEVNAALAGGVEAPLAPLSFGAFTVVRAMSTRNDDPKRASRPFDKDRDGFVMAEGAGFVVLERYADAVSRNAHIYAEITGFGTTNDAHHMAAPLPSGEQTAQAMRAALRDAAVHPAEVETLNAHGSSTALGDRAEVQAYRAVFGERACKIPVSATKGQHGHALGATGAWEIVISALTLSQGRLPGAVNFIQPDEAAIDCRPAVRELTTDVLLTNSSGFGGINSALVLQSVR